MEQLKRHNLTRVDTAWLRMEDPTNLMMSSGLMVFDEPLALDELVGVLERVADQYLRFKMKVVEGPLKLRAPEWVPDAAFDIHAHVHRIALPAPGGDAELQELISDLLSTPLDFTKSPWQVHLIEGLGRGCAVLSRIHHCVADGMALMHVLLSMTEERGGPRRRPQRKPRSFSLAALADTVARGSYSIVELTLAAPDTHTALKGTLGVAKRAAWSERIGTEDLKRAAHLFDATLNDVVVAIISGGLGMYLAERDEDVHHAMVRAAMPVNLREIETAGDKLGNGFGLAYVELPLAPGDPADRILEVKRRIATVKRNHQGEAALVVLAAFGMLPGWLQPYAIDFFGLKASLTLTNVPGPRATRFLAGHPITDFMFWPPVSGRLSTGVSVLSYAGEVRIGVATDAGLVPDPERITHFIDVEARRLMRQLAAVAPRKPRRAAARVRGHAGTARTPVRRERPARGVRKDQPVRVV